MSWNDNLSYQENLGSFLDSLTDYTKVDEDEYKVVNELVDRKKMLKLEIFRKQYGSILKRLHKDTDNFQLKTKKDLIQLLYKDSTVFSFKPARYLSISDLLEKINRDIKNNEFQLREFRDVMISSNYEDDIIKKIDKIRIELLGLYEKKGIIENVFRVLNKTDKYNLELKNKKDMLHKLRVQSMDLNKQMKEFFLKKDILNFQKTAKELATLGITDIELQISELQQTHKKMNDILVIRLPEIVESNEDVLKKQKKKTVKKTAKKKKEDKPEPEQDADDKSTESDKKKKTAKKPKIDPNKEKTESKEEETESKEEVAKGKSLENTTTNTNTMIGGGLNLITSLDKLQTTVADEFENREEVSIGLDIVNEQVGSGVHMDTNQNTDSVLKPESFHTPPYSPSNPDTPGPELNGGAVNTPPSTDVKKVTITSSAIGQTSPEQIGGANMEQVSSSPSPSSVDMDPFTELQSVDMSGGNYSDMTNEINEKMDGGGYGGGNMDVFGSTYQQQPQSEQSSGTVDPFGINTSPPEIVSVTKLGA